MKPDAKNDNFFFRKRVTVLLLRLFDSWTQPPTPGVMCFSLCLVAVKATSDLLWD